jgi:hypothetical protein
METTTMTDNLRDLLPPGSTMTTNVSGQPLDVSHMVAAVLGLKCDKAGRVRVSGGGMDMGFHTVYTLSAKLYGYENRGGYAIRHRRG